MKKRTFLKNSSLALFGISLTPLMACSEGKNTGNKNPKVESLSTPPTFDLPKLAFDFDALEPNIDAKTM